MWKYIHCPVLLSLSAGSAKPGKHYEDVSGKLEFKKGDIKKSIDVPVTEQSRGRTAIRPRIPSESRFCQRTLVQMSSRVSQSIHGAVQHASKRREGHFDRQQTTGLRF